MTTFDRRHLGSILARLGAGAAALLAAALTPAHAQMKVGSRAPDFSVEAAQAGEPTRFTLAEALRNGPAVLFFYPKSFTSVCTEEAYLFAEAMDAFEEAGASVIGISSDNIETQRKFSSMGCRDRFPVGADPELKVIKAYGVGFGIAGAILPFADRVSFVIAPDGRILARVKSSSAQPHVEQTLAAVRNWKASAGR